MSDEKPWCIQFELRGPLPSKKNQMAPGMRAGKDGALHPTVRRNRESLDHQAGALSEIRGMMPAIRAGGVRLPLLCPVRVSVTYEPPMGTKRNHIPDNDGLLTTILDLLQRAGIVFDDQQCIPDPPLRLAPPTKEYCRYSRRGVTIVDVRMAELRAGEFDPSVSAERVKKREAAELKRLQKRGR